MTTPWSCCLIATVLFPFVFSACKQEAVQDGPVLTRISEPIAHAEGPHWDTTEKVLYYVDIAGNSLHRYDPTTKSNKVLKLDQPVSLVVPVRDQKHKFIIGLGRELVLLTWEWETGVYHHSTIVTVDENEPKNRFNDGKADAKGRMWAGTMGYEQPVGQVVMNVATFYRLDNDPTKQCKADVELRPVSISNGLTWSHDNKVLYYIDTPTREIAAFDFDLEKGAISNRRTVFKFGEVKGSPDGMTIDADGNLWIACWGGSQVIRVDPKSGKLLRSIQMPASRVSSVAWGGPKLESLFVTTMKLGLTDKQLEMEPHAGSVWEITNLKTIGTSQNTAVFNCKCK